MACLGGHASHGVVTRSVSDRLLEGLVQDSHTPQVAVVHLLDGVVELLFKPIQVSYDSNCAQNKYLLFSLYDAVSLLFVSLVFKLLLKHHAVHFLLLHGLLDRKFELFHLHSLEFFLVFFEDISRFGLELMGFGVMFLLDQVGNLIPDLQQTRRRFKNLGQFVFSLFSLNLQLFSLSHFKILKLHIAVVEELLFMEIPLSLEFCGLGITLIK
jgi:hypothetical protein